MFFWRKLPAHTWSCFCQYDKWPSFPPSYVWEEKEKQNKFIKYKMQYIIKSIIIRSQWSIFCFPVHKDCTMNSRKNNFHAFSARRSLVSWRRLHKSLKKILFQKYETNFWVPSWVFHYFFQTTIKRHLYILKNIALW